MALQGMVLIILCEFIRFIIYFPINLFFLHGGFSKGLLKEGEVMKYFFPTSGTLHPAYLPGKVRHERFKYISFFFTFHLFNYNFYVFLNQFLQRVFKKKTAILCL